MTIPMPGSMLGMAVFLWPSPHLCSELGLNFFTLAECRPHQQKVLRVQVALKVRTSLRSRYQGFWIPSACTAWGGSLLPKGSYKPCAFPQPWLLCARKCGDAPLCPLWETAGGIVPKPHWKGTPGCTAATLDLSLTAFILGLPLQHQ